MVLCSLHFLTSGPSLGHRVRCDGSPGPVVKLWGSRQRVAWTRSVLPRDRKGPSEMPCTGNHGGQESWV